MKNWLTEVEKVWTTLRTKNLKIKLQIFEKLWAEEKCPSKKLFVLLTVLKVVQKILQKNQWKKEIKNLLWTISTDRKDRKVTLCDFFYFFVLLDVI